MRSDCEDCGGEGFREINIEADEDGPERDVEVYCYCEAGEELMRKDGLW